MSDTPETDAAYKYWPSENAELVDAALARKLERERDEVREKAERYRLEANAMMMQRDGWAAMCGRMMQRDEWAAMCGRYKQERDEVKEKYRFAVIHWQIGAAKMERERDEWKNKAYSHATDYTLMEAKCFRLEQQLKEYDKLKS
jgi:hypothetical protein